MKLAPRQQRGFDKLNKVCKVYFYCYTFMSYQVGDTAKLDKPKLFYFFLTTLKIMD